MVRLSKKNLLELQRIIGYQFKDTNLLNLAVTHRSLSLDNYERLEFLGDSILGVLVSEYLYNKFPNLKEGKLSRIRSSIVCGKSLEEINHTLGLSKFIMTGQGKSKSEQKVPSSLQADVIESLMGAIYLDADLTTCHKVVMPWFAEKFKTLNAEDIFKDAKTQLQEWLQSRSLPLPKYNLKELQNENGQHQFSVECCIECLPKSIFASGDSRRKAEQKAAKKTILAIQKLNLTP